MKDEERNSLIKKLNTELDEYVDGLGKTPYTDGWPEDKWQEEFEKHPLFMTKPLAENEELSPLIQGLQDLKYDPLENTPEELALSYKDDGNYNFKLKKYRFAIANYTEGLKQKCTDDLLNTQLHCNRAVAHFHIKNYRSSLIDCVSALKISPDHLKAIVRASHCLLDLSHWPLCIQMCDRGLMIESGHKQLLEIRIKAEKYKKVKERDDRLNALKSKKEELMEDKLHEAIASRGIKIIPNIEKSGVKLDNNGSLLWSVTFMYPEFGQADVIEEFHEDDTFGAHLITMFGPDADRPSWDLEARYLPHTISIYREYEDSLKPIEADVSLKEQIGGTKFLHPTPCFFLFVRGSDVEKEYLSRYEN